MRSPRLLGFVAAFALSPVALAEEGSHADSQDDSLFAFDLGSTDGLADDDDDSSDEDDFLDDVLGGEPKEDSVQEEQEAVRSGNMGDAVGARQEDVILMEDEKKDRRIIKTLQRKDYMKIARWEVSPHLAFVANDPFLNRYILGTGVGYHLTEIFALQVDIDFSPDLGEGDWKPLTKQLVNENRVSPDISKLTYFGSLTFQFSPLYGKGAVMGKSIINFDIYGLFGMGITATADDLDALQAVGEPRAQATEHQIHPTTNFGGGMRIGFSPNVAARIEGRSMVYIETVNATTLEMKNNFILQASIAFFFPNMKG